MKYKSSTELFIIVYNIALDAFGRLRVSENFTTFNYYPSTLSATTTLDIDVFISKQNGGTTTSKDSILYGFTSSPSQPLIGVQFNVLIANTNEQTAFYSG